MNKPSIKAIVFDVFGTLVDWHTCIAREAEQALLPLGFTTDWSEFALRWRAEYQPSMEEVRAGRISFCKLDVLHRRNLDIVLAQLGFKDVPAQTRQHLTHAWHRLDAWPDVTSGLHQLKSHFLLAPCSNGHIALMVHLARRNGFPWDAILGADLAKDYKPKPGVYLACADAFDITPAETLMVAAHSSDLQAAAACGLKTAFIARPAEYGPQGSETQAACPVDYTANSLIELAHQLGTMV